MASANYYGNSQRNRKKQRSGNGPFNIQVPSSLRDPKDQTFSLEHLSSLKNDDNAREVGLGYLHSHDVFATLWNSTTIHPNTRRLMRKMTQIQTINAVCNSFYRLPDGNKINLDKNRMAYAAEQTKLYSNEYEYDPIRRQRFYDEPSQILVVDGDCLDVVMCLKSRYPQSKLVVLNMASSRNPGGGWKNGAGAQEENLHRRTNMFQCLEDPYDDLEGKRDWSYRVPEFGGIYTPNVSVFRGSEANGYPFFPEGPSYISFIACAAYSHPPTETDHNGEVKLSGKNVIHNTKRKMEAILNIALDNKDDILILSAFGCGAFQNPPKHIAQLFHEVVSKDYVQSFKYIIFAIINDHNAGKAHNPRGNIQPFAEVFQTEILSIDQLQEKISSLTK